MEPQQAPAKHSYEIDLNGHTYVVDSDTELTDDQVFDAAREEAEASTPAAPKPTPSAGGMFGNFVQGSVDMAAGVPRLMMKALTQNPADTAIQLGQGVVDRGKQYWDDMHPVDAWESLKRGSPLQALGQALPVGMAYDDPAGVAADAMALKAGVSGLKKAKEAPGRILRGRAVTKARRALEPPEVPPSTPVDYQWPPQNKWGTVVDEGGEVPPKGGVPQGNASGGRPPQLSGGQRQIGPQAGVSIDDAMKQFAHEDSDFFDGSADGQGDGPVGDVFPRGGTPEPPIIQDNIPPAHGDPSLVPPGEEQAYNESVAPDAKGSADDALYNELMKNMGGGHPGKPGKVEIAEPAPEGDYNYDTRADDSPWPESAAEAYGTRPNMETGELATDDPWHSGEEVEPPKEGEGFNPRPDPSGRSASALHRDTNDMDAGYRRRLADEKGIATTDFLLGGAVDALARKFIQNPTIRTGAKSAVRNISKVPIGPMAEGYGNAAVFSRFINDDKKSK